MRLIVTTREFDPNPQFGTEDAPVYLAGRVGPCPPSRVMVLEGDDAAVEGVKADPRIESWEPWAGGEV